MAHCYQKHCRREASYIIVNPETGFDEQLRAKKYYCLQHGRFIFRSDCQVYGIGTKLYKVQLIAMKGDSNGS